LFTRRNGHLLVQSIDSKNRQEEHDDCLGYQYITMKVEIEQFQSHISNDLYIFFSITLYSYELSFKRVWKLHLLLLHLLTSISLM